MLTTLWPRLAHSQHTKRNNNYTRTYISHFGASISVYSGHPRVKIQGDWLVFRKAKIVIATNSWSHQVQDRESQAPLDGRMDRKVIQIEYSVGRERWFLLLHLERAYSLIASTLRRGELKRPLALLSFFPPPPSAFPNWTIISEANCELSIDVCSFLSTTSIYDSLYNKMSYNLIVTV